MAEEPPKKRRTGTVWRPEENKLIQWNRWSGTRVTVPWPEPRCWERRGGNDAPWREIFGTVPDSVWLPIPASRADWLAPAAEASAWAIVPPYARDCVERASVGGFRWAVLSMVARCPGAVDLCHSVPLLAGALSVANLLRTKTVARPWRSARALLRRPDGMERWIAIAGWLGFEPSRSFVNMLRRITVSYDWQLSSFSLLKSIWAHPLGRKRLRHLTRLDHGVVEALATAIDLNVLERLPQALFEGAFTGGGWAGTSAALRLTVQAWRVMRGERAIPCWRSSEALEADLAILRDEARRLVGMVPALPASPFPPPPWPGSAGIEPLCSDLALNAEGAHLRHCLGNGQWANEARALSGYGYTVTLEKERASLWIRRTPYDPDVFTPSEFRASDNTSPSPRLIALVANWAARNTAAKRTLPPPWNAPWPIRREGPFSAEILALANDDDDIPF